MREIAHELAEVRLLSEVLMLRHEDTEAHEQRPSEAIAAMANNRELPCPMGGCWTSAMVDEVLHLAGPPVKGRTIFQVATKVMNALALRR